MNYERESATLMRDMEEDVFLDLIVCQQQHQQQQHGVAVVEAARILAKETISVGLNSDSDSNEATPVAKIMFLLQRLWNDCENKVGLQMREQQGGETSSIFRENEPNNTLEFAKTTMQMYTSEQVSITLNLSNM